MSASICQQIVHVLCYNGKTRRGDLNISGYLENFSVEDRLKAERYIEEELVFAEGSLKNGYQVSVDNEFVCLYIEDGEIVDTSCTCKHFDEAHGCVHLLSALMYLFPPGEEKGGDMDEKEDEAQSTFSEDREATSYFSSFNINADSPLDNEDEAERITDYFIDTYIQMRRVSSEEEISSFIDEYLGRIVLPLVNRKLSLALRFLDVLRDVAGSLVQKTNDEVFLPPEYEDLVLLVRKYYSSYVDINRMLSAQGDDSGLRSLEDYLLSILTDERRARYSNPYLIDMINEKIETYLTEHAIGASNAEKLLKVNYKVLDNLIAIRNGEEKDNGFLKTPVLFLTGKMLSSSIIAVSGYITAIFYHMLETRQTIAFHYDSYFEKYRFYGFTLIDRLNYYYGEGAYQKVIEKVEEALEDERMDISILERRYILDYYAKATLKTSDKKSLAERLECAQKDERFDLYAALSSSYLKVYPDDKLSDRIRKFVSSPKMPELMQVRFYSKVGWHEKLSEKLVELGRYDLLYEYGAILNDEERHRVVVSIVNNR